MVHATYPDPFLEIRVEHLGLPIPLQGLCAGYQGEDWRGTQLADHLFQWLPFAALNQEHQLSFGAANFVELLHLAASHIYKTKKTVSRGEIGELLFHLICVLHHSTFPVVCKLILKTSPNDTVKGFDGVHLVPSGDSFELWLGEAKFFKDPREAIKEAVASIRLHILPAFLTAEKAMILGHISSSIPLYDKVLPIFKSQTSSDKLLQLAVFPVLVAYESEAVIAHKQVCNQYVDQLKAEIYDLRQYFAGRAADLQLRFRLIFVPMKSKEAVIKRFDQKLEAFL